jgi:hypothetical protein
MLYATIAIWTRELYPDFLCIGVARAATTWMFDRLSQHPDVFLPKRKEVHFLDEPRQQIKDHVLGIKIYRASYFDINRESHWRWYYRIYRGQEGKMKGDMTPAYIDLSEDRIRIVAERMPSLKIILSIRNPVERAWSGLRRTLWERLGKKPSDLETLDTIRHAVMLPRVVEQCDYKSSIPCWEKFYDTNHMLYIFFDDIVEDPRSQLERICEFLNLDKEKLPSPEEDRRRVNAAPSDKMPQEIRQHLEIYYRKQREYLERKFDRDLSHWCKYTN